MKAKLLCVLLMLVLVTSCGTQGTVPDESSTGSGSNPDLEPSELTIVENGQSDFMIVVDSGDERAKTFAAYLQTVISGKTGAFLPIRSANVTEDFEHKILVGDTGAEVSGKLKEQLGAHVFGVAQEGTAMAVYAEGVAGYYELESYLNEVLLASAEQDSWTLTHGVYFGETEPSVFSAETGSAEEYYLVYDSSDGEARTIATRAALQISEVCGVSVKPVSDTSQYPNEILFGTVNRAASQRLARYLTAEDTFVAGVFDGCYVMLSDDRLGLAFALKQLLDTAQESASGDTVEWSSADNVYSALSEQQKNETYADAVTLATQLYGTFSTYADELLSKQPEALEDQQLVDALIARMGDSFAVAIGSSSALYQGYITKLDPTDYSKVTKQSADSHIWIAADFANRYFGETLPTDTDGYVDLTDYCSRNPEYTIDYYEELQVAVVVPEDVPRFLPLREEVNGYTNSEYFIRMEEFFHNSAMPEPGVNTEQSRVEVVRTEHDFTYAYDYTTEVYETFYSPAIWTLDRADGGQDIYVAYEYRKILNRVGYELPTTYLCKSSDGGQTWTRVGEVQSLSNASLFELNGQLVLIGMHNGPGNVMLGIYDPELGTMEIVELTFDVGIRAPCTVAIENGRIYCAFNDAVISADVTSDIRRSGSWTLSNNPQELLSRADFERVTGEKTGANNIFWMEEGNVIMGPDGELYVVYRLDAAPTWGYAVIFRLSADGSTLSVVEECNSIIRFPYTQSKFTVRYDEATGRYVSLTSLPAAQTMQQRNVLGLVISEDLIHWEVVEVLLVDREMLNTTVSYVSHAFQYVDFVFSGDDILFVVREAVGETNYFHDGNYIAMYTLSDYAELIESHLSE